ncbi:MAG: DUF2157 domain-containing protein [Pyrinomonadaceae bacterium]
MPDEETSFDTEMADDRDYTVDATTVRRLYADGVLDEAARDAGLEWLEYTPAWWRWANRTLLFTGSALALAGVVFFFAFNWAKLTPLVKFAMLETALLLCLAAAWRAGLDGLTGKILTLGASVLTGATLAVFGQVYQTGVDAWELFAAWAALILGWVVIAKFGALWLMWIVLVNVALLLYWGQVVVPGAELNDVGRGGWGVYVVLAVINFIALAAREYAVTNKRIEWLVGEWLRWVMWAAVLFYLTIPGVALASGASQNKATIAAGALLSVAVAIGQKYFRKIAPDLFALTLCVFSACVVVITLIGRVVFKFSGRDFGAGSLLLMGLIVIGVFALAGLWLRATGAEMKGRRS